MELIKICAWCGKALGTGGTTCESECVPITHGICRDCKDKVLEETRNANLQNQEGR